MRINTKKHTRYSDELKESVLLKVCSQQPINLVKWSQETNIPYTTLRKWVIARQQNINLPLSSSPHDLSSDIKYQAVLDTANMTDEQRSEYCRNKGVYVNHLEEWKKNILESLNVISKKKKSNSEIHKLNAENKLLKRELARKDKALAEVSALLILKKKADLIWGVNEDV